MKNIKKQIIININSKEKYDDIIKILKESDVIIREEDKIFNTYGSLTYLHITPGKVMTYGNVLSTAFRDYNDDAIIDADDFIYKYGVEEYSVTQKQLDIINELKHRAFKFLAFVNGGDYINPLKSLDIKVSEAVLRYIGGDDSIQFKALKQYFLYRKDDNNDTVYMYFFLGTPSWTRDKDYAFTASLDEIEKWNSPSWEIGSM